MLVWRPNRHRGVLLLTATCLGSGPAWAQYGGGYPTLPATIADTRIGDLRGQLQQYLPGVLPRTTGPAFLVSTSIGADIGATDNAARVDRPRRADLFTELSPTILVSGDTARLKVNLNYAPVASIYAKTPSQTRFDQFGNLVTLATIVPEVMFVDLRGSITQQSRTGGYAQTSTQALNQSDQIQTVALSVTPYAERRISGWGTARIGYSLAETRQNSPRNQDTLNANQAVLFNNTGIGAVGNLLTQRERASFATGENFGRINNVATAEAIQYSGDGAYKGAHRNQLANEIGYAVTRTITALAGVGYQDLRFGGSPGVRISEPLWSVGGRIAPNPDSTLTVTYGHRDGFNAAAVDGSYAPSARTRLFVRYSTGLTTDAEEQQNLLQSTNVGPTGLLIDSVTGAPVSSTSGAFGTQNNLYRLRRFSITGLLVLNRDSLTIGIAQEDRTNVNSNVASTGTSALPAGVSNTGVLGSLSWQHELSPTLSGSASVSYTVENSGRTDNASQSGSPRTIQTGVSLAYIITETLSASARYLFTDHSGNIGPITQPSINPSSSAQAGQNFIENLLLVGLRKSF